MAFYVYTVSMIRYDNGTIKTTGTVGYKIADDEATVKGHAFDKSREMYPGFKVEDIYVLRVEEDDLFAAYQDMLRSTQKTD
jgi:hypothetical protein